MPNERAEYAKALRNAIAANVRAEAARHNRGQAEMGDALGLTKSSVSLRLKGEVPFRGEELALLAEDMGVSVEQFIPWPVSPVAAA